MIDETDLSQEKRWYYENRCRTAISSFQRKGLKAQYVPDKESAKKAVLELVPLDALVFRGDSVTLDQIGIVPALAARGRNEVVDPLERKADGSFAIPEAEHKKVARGAFSADVFLVGSNAVTLDGKLVNTDGRGNRVAPMIYGPDRVIVVAGANKLVNDLAEALERIRRIAAPVNARRHYLKHNNPHFGELPCVQTGKCVDCNHDWRICHYTVVIDGAMLWERGRINLVLVGEELGI
jgi:hypothetical protein